VVVYEMCTFTTPFRAQSMEELFRRVTKGVYDRLPQTYSPQLHELVRKCLTLSKESRPSAASLVKAFFPEMAVQSMPETFNMIGTIHMPKNLKVLKERLPKSRYMENRPQLSEPRGHSDHEAKLPPIAPETRRVELSALNHYQRPPVVDRRREQELQREREAREREAQRERERELLRREAPQLPPELEQGRRGARVLPPLHRNVPQYAYRKPEWWG
jgi:NIMA (never in mitosis gene a)-related kinase